MDYKGVIIEESLDDTSVLKDVKILKTKVEDVTQHHKTPWLKRWTLHTVEVPENKARETAKNISQSIEKEHPSWYADYKNEKYHYIIFPNKIFKVERTNALEYNAAKDYGISLGIPEYQVNFAPDVKK